jgi:hypothetical protein
LILENVETNAALGVDIGMIDLGRELDVRGLERVVCGNHNVQMEDAACVRTVRGSKEMCSPMKEIRLVDETG